MRALLLAVLAMPLMTWADSTLSTKAPDEPAQLDDTPFSTHVTLPAKSLKPGKVAFRPAPGSDMAFSSFKSNTLAVGLPPRFEIGTIPNYWFESVTKFNVMAKAELYRHPEFQVGWGINYGSARLNFGEQEDQELNLKMKYYQTGLMANWLPANSRWKYGFNVGSYLAQFRLNNLPEKTIVKRNPNYYGDVGYRLSSQTQLTTGFSYADFSQPGNIISRNIWGFGASVGLTPRLPWLSLVSLGVHHYPETRHTRFLWQLAI